ncbi:MAG: hypothetical protein M5R38_04735 [Candidatus Methylomirabilis sp.]|nr:hypothetical protein [Candidatus Methylomirabilis sp.]
MAGVRLGNRSGRPLVPEEDAPPDVAPPPLLELVPEGELPPKAVTPVVAPAFVGTPVPPLNPKALRELTGCLDNSRFDQYLGRRNIDLLQQRLHPFYSLRKVFDDDPAGSFINDDTAVL